MRANLTLEQLKSIMDRVETGKMFLVYSMDKHDMFWCEDELVTKRITGIIECDTGKYNTNKELPCSYCVGKISFDNENYMCCCYHSDAYNRCGCRIIKEIEIDFIGEHEFTI